MELGEIFILLSNLDPVNLIYTPFLKEETALRLFTPYLISLIYTPFSGMTERILNLSEKFIYRAFYHSV